MSRRQGQVLPCGENRTMKSVIARNRLLAMALCCCALSTIPSTRTSAQSSSRETRCPDAIDTYRSHGRNSRLEGESPRETESRFECCFEMREVEIDAKSLTAQVVFTRLPYGVYAVSLFHDENRNGKLDCRFLKIPTEGTAFPTTPRNELGSQDTRRRHLC